MFEVFPGDFESRVDRDAGVQHLRDFYYERLKQFAEICDIEESTGQYDVRTVEGLLAVGDPEIDALLEKFSTLLRSKDFTPGQLNDLDEIGVRYMELIGDAVEQTEDPAEFERLQLSMGLSGSLSALIRKNPDGPDVPLWGDSGFDDADDGDELEEFLRNEAAAYADEDVLTADGSAGEEDDEEKLEPWQQRADFWKPKDG